MEKKEKKERGLRLLKVGCVSILRMDGRSESAGMIRIKRPVRNLMDVFLFVLACFFDRNK